MFNLPVETRDERRDHPLEISVPGYSVDDLTDAALRSALFGERHPLADQHMSVLAEMRDPVAEVSGSCRASRLTTLTRVVS